MHRVRPWVSLQPQGWGSLRGGVQEVASALHLAQRASGECLAQR